MKIVRDRKAWSKKYFQKWIVKERIRKYQKTPEYKAKKSGWYFKKKKKILSEKKED